MVKVMKNKYDFRIEMIKTAQEYSVSETAHIFNVSRPTVYKWVNRFKSEGIKGLQDRSSRPHLSPNSLSDEKKKKILKLRKRWPSLSPERMQNEFGVVADIKTIYKVLVQHGLVNKKQKKKRQKQRDLRKWKEANFEPLQYWQIDTKDCSDIPYYVERIRKHHFPRYLFQARDVRTGVLFSHFATEQTVTNATVFVDQLLSHLQSCGVKTESVTIQTDNGSEFIPPNSLKESAFTQKVYTYNATHIRIPPGAKTWQSEVERANGLIEYELLAYEKWNTIEVLKAKTTAWEYYFNRLRKNTYHQNRSPYTRMIKAGIKSKMAEAMCHWRVNILDENKKLKLNNKILLNYKSVNKVYPSVINNQIFLCSIPKTIHKFASFEFSK